MTVAFDATATSAAGTTQRSWTHTPTGTPRGIVVYVNQYLGTTDEVTSVTYGDVAMTEMTGSPLLSTAQAEVGAVYAYFLDTGIPTGAQTVLVNVNATASAKRATSISVTAAADTQVVDTTVVDTTVANPSVTIQGGATTNFYSASILSGANASANIVTDAGETELISHDFANACGVVARLNSITTGDQTISWTVANLPAAIIGSAISEVSAATSGYRNLMMLGCG